MRATTDLYDDFEDSCQTCSLQFRDFGARKRFHGPVRTVECFEDNVLFRRLLNEPGDGAVIVVDGKGSTARALMGDMLAARASANGWAGIIINGLAIEDMGASTPTTQFYRRHVITPGGFVMTARGLGDYEPTLRAKILRELARPTG